MFKYLAKSVKRVLGCEPSHPLSMRTFRKDGELVPAQTEDNTVFDAVVSPMAPSVAEMLAAGEVPQRLGDIPELNGLAAAEVAQRFLAAFAAAGRAVPAPAAPAAPAAPIVEPSKTE